jgi:GTP-binding protein YchF
MLKVGIVGLPNVGKSTLFNALLRKESALAANYPFATIDPNIGVVDVPDPRLHVLADIVKTEKITPAAIEFYDIAGLVRGASEGEGLGNTFLSHIRETALMCHVVRLFEDSDITHVDESPDAVRDIDTIETELILADLATLTHQKEPKGSATKEERFVWDILQYVQQHLNKGTAARHMGLSEEQRSALKQYNLLTLKPVLYVFNVSEGQLEDTRGTHAHIQSVLSQTQAVDPDYLFISAKLEQDIVALDQSEQDEYLQQFGLSETGLNRLVQAAYEKLGLISFLTAGEKEVRAWTVITGTLAPQAAGTIHTDFEKKFIKAEVVKYNDFIAAPGWAASRAQGKALMGGKDYVMLDGDVVEFKVGA